jgi:hypothetical protein
MPPATNFTGSFLSTMISFYIGNTINRTDNPFGMPSVADFAGQFFSAAVLFVVFSTINWARYKFFHVIS